MRFFCVFTSILLLESTASSAVLDGAVNSRYDIHLRKRIGPEEPSYRRPAPNGGDSIEDGDYDADDELSQWSAAEGSAAKATIDGNSVYQEITEGSSLWPTEIYEILDAKPAGEDIVKSAVVQEPGEKDVFVYLGTELENVRHAWKHGFGIELLYDFKSRVSEAVLRNRPESAKGSITKAIASGLYTTTIRKVSLAEKAQYKLLLSTAMNRAQSTGGKVLLSPGGSSAWQGVDVDDIPIKRRDFHGKRMEEDRPSYTYQEPAPYTGPVEDHGRYDYDYWTPGQHQLEDSKSVYEEIAGESSHVTGFYPILSKRPAANEAGQYGKSFNLLIPGQKDVYVFIGQDLPNVGDAWFRGKGMALLQDFQKSTENQPDSGSGPAGKAKAIGSKLFTSKFSRVSTSEKIKYATLTSIAKAKAQETGGRVFISAGQQTWQGFDVGDIPIRRRDSQGNRFEARSPDTDTFVKPALLKDTAVSKGSSHASLAQVATLLDVSTPATVQRRMPSDSVIQSLSKDTSGGSPQSNSSTLDASSKFEAVLALYEAVQANISATIFPILTEMTSKTNSSLIFQAAQSIWIDLVSPSEIAVGPFQQGLNSLDQLVDSQAKALNITVSDPAFKPYLEVGTILIDIYQGAWNRSYAAINQNGLLTKFNTLMAYLSVSTNSTVAPPSFFQVRNNTYDDTFFTDYTRNNKNLDRFLQ